MIIRDKLIDFLKAVDKDFPIPLSQKIKLEDLADKFIKNGTLVYQLLDNEIIALAGGYTKNTVNNTAYISVCACRKEYRNMGISSALIKLFIKKCHDENLSGVHLYTRATNHGAINMYKRIGFTEYNCDLRAGDIHLIYNIK